MKIPIPRRIQRLQESVIREMTRIAQQEEALNLSQGIPDFPAPASVKMAGREALGADRNQYSYTYGLTELRHRLSQKLQKKNRFIADPETEITITCGVSEGLVAACLALLERGDEVLILEPYYENYLPALILAGARPVFLTLRHPDFPLDLDRLEKKISPRTRALILNTPMNPSGKVFKPEELRTIAAICQRHNLLVITDEIYEDIIYDQREHLSIAALENMFDRTVSVMGFSKSYGITGWRLGYVAAPRPLSQALRKVHDYLTICAPTPLQWAALAALKLPPDYYRDLKNRYRENRELLCGGLQEMGFILRPPEGAYYVMADFSSIAPGRSDFEFARFLATGGGVATVPGSSFYSGSRPGRHLVRFSFAVRASTIKEALARIRKRVG